MLFLPLEISHFRYDLQLFNLIIFEHVQAILNHVHLVVFGFISLFSIFGSCGNGSFLNIAIHIFFFSHDSHGIIYDFIIIIKTEDFLFLFSSALLFVLIASGYLGTDELLDLLLED